MSITVRVKGGDITREPSNGLITAVNCEGMWFGGIDRAIYGVAGNHFHAQALMRMPLHDGDVVFALGAQKAAFDNVIFVVDDLQRPLREVVYTGLQQAEMRQLAVVTLPSLRTGVMAGAYEQTVEAALDETVAAIRQFLASGPSYVRQLTVVVYNDPASVSYLQGKLQLI